MDTSDEYIQQSLSQLTSDSESFQVVEYKKGKAQKRNVSSDELKAEVHRATVTWHQLLQLWALCRDRPVEASQHESMSTLTPGEFSQILERMGYRDSS